MDRRKYYLVIEVFGLDRLRKEPFILPSTELFPYDNLNNADQFHKFFQQLCKYWNLNPIEINVKFFDDIKSKEWTNLAPQGNYKDAGGFYYQTFSTDEKRFQIHLAKSNLNNPQLLISVIAHELAHVKLLGGNYVNKTDPDLEPLTDLASIYFGFGIFVANSCQTQDINWITRTGYLPDQLISYANALICYLSGYDANKYLPLLNKNTKELFRKDYNFLTEINDTALTERKIREGESAHKVAQQITLGLEKRLFNDVIEGSKKQLELNPRNTTAFNNIGYALLLQKKYSEAIDSFTQAIDIDPFWDYPYNNRGYCKLQLGEIESAFVDLHSSFEMNPDNSFSWRNMGAYYLKTNDFEKALKHFEEAEKIDPKTELINFYLGITHQKMSNQEKANHYLKKSKTLNEHNDSVID